MITMLVLLLVVITLTNALLALLNLCVLGLTMKLYTEFYKVRRLTSNG